MKTPAMSSPDTPRPTGEPKVSPGEAQRADPSSSGAIPACCAAGPEPLPDDAPC